LSGFVCDLQADCAVGLGNAVQGLHECTGIAIAEDQPATPLIDAVLWSRYFWYCVTKQTQFQLTAVLTVVLFSLVGAFTFSSFPLHPFHLIDLNLMIDTLSPMCLCYERMRLSLERYLIALKPDEVRNVSITPEMRREILGQAAYQTTLVSFIYLIAPAAFPERYTDPMINGEPSNLKLGSFCYNLIWWMNYFNLFNCRCLIPRGMHLS
jgi:magnesium-transporting ATPase (P-type)